MINQLESETLRKLIDNLQAAGCGKYVALPQIAVMGDTSCGKSSLLSALSGIEFPSSEKLTTRCPTQIIMANNAKEVNPTFTATVKLRRFGKQDDNNNSSAPEKTLSRIHEITRVIEELTKKLIDEGQEISDDCIVISAKGPDLPNLTIIDLPGLVRTVKDGESETMINRIRSLVKRYLDQSRTIILSVVPANVDIHNTEILQLAKEVDPEGDRTISVITKPDLVDKGAEDSVIQLLMNKTKKLKLLYHCIKCRGQQQLNKGITISQAIVSEKDFFSTTDPWKDVPNDLVGIEKLQAKLANLLELRIKESLPSVQKEIRTKLDAAREELEALGSSLSDTYSRRKYYGDVMDRQYHLMECAIDGKYDRHPGFFSSKDDNDSLKLRSSLNALDLAFQAIVAKVHIKVKFSEMEVGDKVSVLHNNAWLDGQSIVSIDSLYKTLRISDGTASKVSKDYEIRPSLTALKETISRNRGDEIPFFPSYSVFVSLVQERIYEWKSPMTHLLDQYNKACEHVVKSVIEKSTSNTKLRLLMQTEILEGCLREVYIICAEKLNECFEKEMKPFTMNHYLYDTYNAMKDEYVISAINGLVDVSGNISKAAVLGILKNGGIGAQSSNEDQQALQTLMAASAYLKVAKKRFIDEIPMILRFQFLDPLLKAMKSVRMQKSDAELKILFKSSDREVNHRKSLEEQIGSLSAANDLIIDELRGKKK